MAEKLFVRLCAQQALHPMTQFMLGPKTLELTNVPLARLPRYERQP